MRKDLLGIALASAIILSFLPAAFAQTNQPSEATKASSPDQAHDLSGVWFDDHPRLITVMQRYWAYEFTKDEPPMTPWGQAQFNAAKPSFGPHAFPLAETNDPIYHTCVPMGFPRIFSLPVADADRSDARRSHHAFRVRLAAPSDFYGRPGA